MQDNDKTEIYIHTPRPDHTDVVPSKSKGESVFTPYDETMFIGKPDEDRHSPGDNEDFPATIGPYGIIEPIGKGGMGTIYKAEHIHLKRTVAVKVINEKYLNDEAAEEWFKFETMIMGQLQHPNIVQTTDAGIDEGRRYLVMELLKGNDLSEHIKKNGPLKLQDALFSLKQAALALGAAHTHHIVHRDVKPSNFFLTEEGQIKLLDLGLAQCLCKPPSSKHPESGLAGSPCFMAPEQILGKTVDARSDLYSLGHTFYYMLTGIIPFDFQKYNNVNSIFHAQLYESLPAIETNRDDVPKSVEQLLERMTAKRPEDRFQTMHELIDAIDRIGLCEPIASRKAAQRKKTRSMAILSVVITPLVLFLIAHLSQAYNSSTQVYCLKVDRGNVGIENLMGRLTTCLFSFDTTNSQMPDVSTSDQEHIWGDAEVTCSSERHLLCMDSKPNDKECMTDHNKDICLSMNFCKKKI